MSILFLDTETYSETPIKDGTYKYAENAEIMLVTYAVDDGPVHHVDLALGIPDDWWLVSDLLKRHDTIIAHNAMFDRSVLRLNRQYPIEVPIEKWRCCMVKALAHGLPGSLAKLCTILNVGGEDAKHDSGKSLIQLFCKPRPKNAKIRRATYETHPEEWEQFIKYAKSDITAMREAWHKLPSWNYGETGAGKIEVDLWHRDQRMNDRGMLIDLDLAHAAIEATEKEKDRLAKEIAHHTAGDVPSSTKRDRLLEYLLVKYGLDLPDLQGSTIDRLLDDPRIDDGAKLCLRNRQQATMTSTSKYKSVVKAVDKHGRLCGTIQMNGAARTRRDAGRTFQPQNLPSRGLLAPDQIALAIRAFKARCADLLFDDVMLAATSSIRGLIVAPEGKKLVVVDLSNIEGRGLAYVAGEEWKLNAFEDYDVCLGKDGTWYSGDELKAAAQRGAAIPLAVNDKGEAVHRGPDLYKLAYAKSFRVAPESVNKFQRNIGKVQELALGYAGGVNAFVMFADAYSIDLDAMAEEAWPALPNETVAEAEDFLDWMVKQKKGSLGLSKRAFVTCEVFKRLWRQAHPNVVSFWAELEDNVRLAIQNPGQTFVGRCFKTRRDGAWLRVRLPSGRFLCYPSPEVDESGGISYMGVNQYTRKWERIRTYSGKLVENCIAADTPVLTSDGWVPIQRVSSLHRLWDGEEWVTCGGAFYSGNNPVYSVFGAAMTADHQVLTTEGWKNASSCQGYYRAPCRVPDGYPLRRGREREVDLGGSVRLRPDETVRPVGIPEAVEEGDHRLLWLHEAGNDRQAAHDTRDVEPPSFRCMAKHDRPVHAADTPSMEKLRRAWHNSVRTVARVLHHLLGRHGADVPSRVDTRADGQFQRVFAGELPLANVEAPGEQPTKQPDRGDPSRKDDRRTGGTEVRNQRDDYSLPAGPWVADRAVTRATYDIVNAGPRNRFVICGAEGALIVHNCVQSMSRDIMFDNIPRIEAAGYEIVTRVHDELPAEAPDDPQYNAEHMGALLATPPDWAPDIPLAAAGFETDRYMKD